MHNNDTALYVYMLCEHDSFKLISLSTLVLFWCAILFDLPIIKTTGFTLHLKSFAVESDDTLY